MRRNGKGWRGEPGRHALAAHGIKTSTRAREQVLERARKDVEDLLQVEQRFDDKVQEFKDYIDDEYGEPWYRLRMQELEGKDIARAQRLFAEKVEIIRSFITAETQLPEEQRVHDLDALLSSHNSIWWQWKKDLKLFALLGFAKDSKAEEKIRELRKEYKEYEITKED